MKKFLVSTANAFGYDQNDNLLFVGKTLLDSSIETTLANTDVRAGQGNQLQYIYYHTAEMNVTINEAQFSLEFLALNTGSQIKIGEDVFTEETITLTNGAGTVTKGTPLALSTGILYGWVALNDGTIERVTFSGSNFSISNPTFSGDVCVRYFATNNAARSVTIYADMMPATIRLVLEGILASSEGTTNKVGKVQIIVPKASMTGAFTLSMTPDSVSQTPLAVRALADDSLTSAGCDGNRPVYAKIVEIIDNAHWYDNVTALAIDGGDISLESGDTKSLKVIAIPTSGAAFLADMADITFSTSTPATATIAAGVVTAVAIGTTTIKATITAKDTVDANVVVTVTA